MDSEPLKDAYWRIVADCLRLYHGYSADAACSAVLGLRQEVEHPIDPPPGYMRDLFYHEEPFYVACDLARNELSLDAYAAVYMPMMRGRHAAAERIVFAGGRPRTGMILDGVLL
jgi:hypothetical protein